MAVPPTAEEIDPAGWADGFDGLFAQVGGPVLRAQGAPAAGQVDLLGLLSGLERKNGWSLAEFAGDTRPDGIQRLLNRAKWNADAVRGALRALVASVLVEEG